MFKRDLEFYSIETAGIDFCSILRDINNKSNKSSKEGGRVLEVGTFDISLMEFNEDNDFCEGIIVRSDKEDLPLIGNIFTKVLRILGLKKDEGLIDMTYFCYIKKLNILCLLPARKGVKWGTFKYYIQSIHVIKNNFEIYPLLTKNAIKKYKKMGSITFVDAILHIGNNSQPSSNKIQDTPLLELIQEAKNANAGRLKLEIFNEKHKGGLEITPIKQFVEILRKVGVLYDAESIRIKGSTSSEESDVVIDLIKDRYKLKIDLGDRSRYLNFDECSKNVHKAINDNLEDIKELIE